MKKHRTLFLNIIFICITIANCSKTESDLTIRKGILTVGMDISFPPMEYYGHDGKTPEGFNVEVAGKIAEKLNLELEIIGTSWEGIFSGVETNRYDCIISSVTILPERLSRYNFSKPYIGNSLVIVTLDSSQVKPLNPSELAGLGVAYQTETTSKYLMTQLLEEGIKFIPFEYDLGVSCFDELLLGRVDAVVSDMIIAQNYISKPGSHFEITWHGEPDQFYGICLKKGNDDLTEAIEIALDELFAEGTMRMLSIKYLGYDMVSAVRH